MECELSSTPKLSLSKLPSKPREPTDLLTPPLKTLASIPFQWEVAPGKPKATTISTANTTTMVTTPPPKNKAARCLDLPPRLLLNDAQVTNLPSPITVLDGPYEGRSLSQTLSFSFRKGSFHSKQRSRYGSWRLGSFKEDRKFGNKHSLDFSVSVKDASKKGTNVKITRIRRRGSFLNFFGTSSNPLVGIYESFKLAVPWGRRQERP